MADTLDEVPVVELGDTFGQDFFVGPPPTSSDTNSDPSAARTVPTGALDRPNPWASPTEEQKKLQLKQQKRLMLEDFRPTSTTGTNGQSNHNSLTDPVPYTPDHPTQIKANLELAIAMASQSSNMRSNRGRTKIMKRSDNLLPGSIIRPPLRSYAREPQTYSNPTTSTANFELVRPTLQPINLPTPSSITLPQTSSPHVLNSARSIRPNGNWTRPGLEPRFAGAPNFTTFGNGAPQPRFAQVNFPQVPSGLNLPPPAHSGLANSYSISTPPSNIRPMTTPAQVGNFSPQAQPVRSALSDFLRQLQSSGVDINNLAQQFQNNNFSTNQPMDSTNFYNESLLNQQQQQQQQQIPQMQNLGPTVFVNNMATGQSMLQQAGPPPPVPPPKPVLPNEDDMAMQDKEVDADHDEEYHEIETYSDYVPAKLGFGHPHPDPVVETSSLSTVEPPDVSYTLKIPSKVISSAALSSLQLESVIYASQKHLQVMPDGKSRYGFLIGDGAGVGKGRTIAGVIYENYLCGRKKAIWLSVSTDLMHDAMRDLKDIGMDIRNFPVRGLKDFKYGKKISMDQGIIFITYSGLVSKSQSVKGNLGSRMGQLIAWVGSNFEGCLVFDECHKAKNIAFGDKKSKKQSKAAECVLEIQAKLPNARVVYASATGASETKHLGYMVRLGMWGPGTAYPTFQFFCEAIERRGVGAMELVAVDLKMRGSYIARQLSFKTTSFEIQYAPLTQQFIKLYDDCVDLWNLAFQHFREAEGYFTGDKKFTRTIWSLYWASHQKFFKYLCISAKVPVVVEIAKKALADGKCVVIGLQSTGEAKTLEALEDGDINEFVSTAKATFESLIENHFPAPGRPKRPRRGTSEDSDLNYAAFGKSESGTNSGSSSSSTVDELYASDYSCKFVIQDGIALPVVTQPESSRRSTRSAKGDQNTSTTARATRNKKALQDLVNTKKAAEKGKSTRAQRAKRRATLRGGEKSRIKKANDSDSEDTEVSNPLSSCSSETAQSPVSDDTYQEDDSESEDDTIYEESGSDDELAVIGTKAARKNNKKLIEDSDSDIEIMAIKPRKQHDVVMIVSDDEEEEEEDRQAAEQGVDRKDVEVDPFIKHGARLSQMRDELFEKVNALGPLLPNNTLDHLIDELGGPDQVAEMTGRKGRVVKDANGMVSYRQRNEVDTLDDMNIAEKDRFMSGKKLIAIISEAASSGISLQADKRVKNTRRRVHITIELPWSADRAIQQFGRTHRSNQISGPEYIFVISELAGERRFASIVAKRLESLGALTHGDRRATSESRDLSQFNIASRYCKTALELIARLLECETRFADIQPVYPRGSFLRDARNAYVGVGLGRWLQRGIFVPEAIAINVNMFLNRILGMKVHIQNSLFKLFTDYTDRLIIRKKVSGQYDAGILELNSESGKAQVGQPEDFYLLTKSGKFLCTLRNVKVERGITWDAALAMYNNRSDDDERSGFYVSTNPLTRSKLVSLLIRNDIDQFRIYKPNTGKQPKPEFYGVITSKSETHKVSHAEAERIWNHVYASTDSRCIHLCFFNSCKRIEAKMKCDVGLRHRYYCILSGSILTAWPHLEKKVPDATKKINIVRIKLDVHNRVIGPIIPQDCLDRVRNALRLAEREGVDF